MALLTSESLWRKLSPAQNMTAPNRYSQKAKSCRSWACVARRQRKSTHTASAHTNRPDTSEKSRVNCQSNPSVCMTRWHRSRLRYHSVTATGMTMNGSLKARSITTAAASVANSSVSQRQLM